MLLCSSLQEIMKCNPIGFIALGIPRDLAGPQVEPELEGSVGLQRSSIPWARHNREVGCQQATKPRKNINLSTCPLRFVSLYTSVFIMFILFLCSC